MPRNTKLRMLRDDHIRKRFRHHTKRNPRWRVEAIIQLVAGEVFLSEVTIAKILRGANEAVPTAPTVAKYTKARAA